VPAQKQFAQPVRAVPRLDRGQKVLIGQRRVYGTAGFEGALANLNAANQVTRLVSDWIAAKAGRTPGAISSTTMRDCTARRSWRCWLTKPKRRPVEEVVH
jgi:hypothetical protein